MTMQTLRFGKREFVVIPKRDYQRLAAQARSKNRIFRMPGMWQRAVAG